MAEVKSDRRQALELAIASIDRQFGKGAIMRLGQSGALDEIAVIPTGAMSLDVALGIGGIPRGRVTEIYGPESSGKTTLALHVIAEAQRLGGTAAFIDAEHALDPIYAKNLGSIPTSSSSPSPTRASRRSRSPKPWCAPTPSMSS